MAETTNEMQSPLEAAIQEAETRRRIGDTVGALQRYRDLLTQRLAEHRTTLEQLTVSDMVIVERTTELATLVGDTDAADHLLDGMAILLRRANNRYSADYVLTKRIHLALACGDVERVSGLLAQMAEGIGSIDEILTSISDLPRWEAQRTWPATQDGERAILFTRLYLVIGWYLAASGHYAWAQILLQRGVDHTAGEVPPAARQVRPHLLLQLARVQMETGDLPAALAELARIEPTIDRRLQPGLYCQWLELHAKINLLRGELGAALNQCQEALEFCKAHSLPRAALRAALNMAQVLTYHNQTVEAKRLVYAAMDLARRYGDRTIGLHVHYLYELVLARGRSMAADMPVLGSRTMGQHPNDRKHPVPSSRASFIPPRSTSFLIHFENQALLFHYRLEQQEFGEAARHLVQMQRMFGATDSSLIKARLTALEGILEYYRGKTATAASLLAQAAGDLAHLDLKPELWQVQRFLNWCWAKLEHTPSDRQKLVQETDQLLASLTETLPVEQRAIFLLNKWTADEEYIAFEIAHLMTLKQRLMTSPRPLRLWQRWRMMKRLHALLLHLDRYKDALARQVLQGKDASEQRPVPKSLWARLMQHPQERMTLVFLVLPDRTLVVQIGRLSLDFGVSSVTRLQIREWVRHWHEQAAILNRRSRSIDPLPPRDLLHAGISPADIAKQADESSQQVMAQLAYALQIPAILDRLPAHIQALTIVPDDSLHGLPFAGLMYAGKPLVERYSLTLTFETLPRISVPAARFSNTLLFIGVSNGAPGIASLPGAQQEVEQIVSVVERLDADTRLRKRHVLLNEQADKARLVQLLPQAHFLHMACHGIFKHDQPDGSGLVLIPEPDRVQLLTLRELSSMNLSRLHHATLSSCWSANHFVFPGRWIISLPETLWRAGTHSILGCLWEVSDRVAVPFMARFYEYLEQHPRAEALRLTQLDCLHRRLPGCKGIDIRSPFYWAGFNLYGEPGELQL